MAIIDTQCNIVTALNGGNTKVELTVLYVLIVCYRHVFGKLMYINSFFLGDTYISFITLCLHTTNKVFLENTNQSKMASDL